MIQRFKLEVDNENRRKVSVCDFVAVEVREGKWVMDVVVGSLANGFLTENSPGLIPWSEQGVSVLRCSPILEPISTYTDREGRDTHYDSAQRDTMSQLVS